MLQEGVPEAAVQFERQVDLKYGYQISELTLPFPPDTAPAQLREELSRLFTDAHTQAFGYNRDDPIEMVSLRLQATAAATQLQFTNLAQHLATHGQAAFAAPVRQAYFGPQHGLQDTPIRRREDIKQEENGPLIVEEPDTTIVVPPGWTIRRDALGNLILRAVS